MKFINKSKSYISKKFRSLGNKITTWGTSKIVQYKTKNSFASKVIKDNKNTKIAIAMSSDGIEEYNNLIHNQIITEIDKSIRNQTASIAHGTPSLIGGFHYGTGEDYVRTKMVNNKLEHEIGKNFTGAIMVERVDDKGKVIKNEWDIIEYKNGKRILTSTGSKGKSSIKDVEELKKGDIIKMPSPRIKPQIEISNGQQNIHPTQTTSKRNTPPTRHRR